MKYGYCLPINTKRFNTIKLPVDQSTQVCKTIFKKPFFTQADDKDTVRLFVNALSNWQHEDAKVYISKNFAHDFNLNELSHFFKEAKGYKCCFNIEFENMPKNCKSNSIVVCDKEKEQVVHLYLIKEPDKFSNWKIYGIEKE